MTIPFSLLQRAKQGDAGAIAALMNDALQAQDIRVKVSLDDCCLQVMLKSAVALNQATCVLFLQRGLCRLQPESITSVRAFAWQLGEAFPHWVVEFPFAQMPLAPNQSVFLPQNSLNPESSTAAPEPASPPATATETTAKPSPKAASARMSAASKPRSDIFKLGFMVVLLTMVYFVMTGV